MDTTIFFGGVYWSSGATNATLFVSHVSLDTVTPALPLHWQGSSETYNAEEFKYIDKMCVVKSGTTDPNSWLFTATRSEFKNFIEVQRFSFFDNQVPTVTQGYMGCCGSYAYNKLVAIECLSSSEVILAYEMHNDNNINEIRPNGAKHLLFFKYDFDAANDGVDANGAEGGYYVRWKFNPFYWDADY